jgi:hypothetical protein
MSEAEIPKVFIGYGAVKALAARFLCGPFNAPKISSVVEDNLGRFNQLALFVSNGSHEHAAFKPIRSGVIRCIFFVASRMGACDHTPEQEKDGCPDFHGANVVP